MLAGAKNSGYIAALLIVVALMLWMLSAPATEPEKPVPPLQARVDTTARVATRPLQGEPRAIMMNLSGRTEAGRQITLKAEIRARVVRIPAREGDLVNAGSIIVELDPRDWPARVEQAEANLRQRQLEQKSARRLYDKGLTNDAQMAQADTLLANANAELTSARLQLDATRIRAPFTGILNELLVEPGDYLQDGNPVARLLDFNPWLVTANVPENQVHKVRVGQTAHARVLDGHMVEGTVRYLSRNADAATRSFRVELAIANPEQSAIPAGISADLQIPLGNRQAYHISPALLVLDASGQTGVKILDEHNKVDFSAVELLEADDQGVWITGPAPGSLLITRGAGFVEYGQTVLGEQE